MYDFSAGYVAGLLSAIAIMAVSVLLALWIERRPK